MEHNTPATMSSGASSVILRGQEISGSVCDASDILYQIDRDTLRQYDGSVIGPAYEAGGGDGGVVLSARQARKRSSSECEAPVRGDRCEFGDSSSTSAKKRGVQQQPLPPSSLASIVAGTVTLRNRISMYEHLQRLLYVLTWSDRHGGRWMGIKNFIDCYFSTVFHSYFGTSFTMNILHVAKTKKICAIFSPGSDRTYTILIMLNYPLWNRLLQISTSFPNKYFRRSVRCRLNVHNDVHRLQLQQNISSEDVSFCNANSVLPSSSSSSSVSHYRGHVGGGGGGGGVGGISDTFSPLFNVSLAALCLVDRLEYSMHSDLESSVPHVVTLAKFFANSQDARQVFQTTLLYE